MKLVKGRTLATLLASEARQRPESFGNHSGAVATGLATCWTRGSRPRHPADHRRARFPDPALRRAESPRPSSPAS